MGINLTDDARRKLLSDWDTYDLLETLADSIIDISYREGDTEECLKWEKVKRSLRRSKMDVMGKLQGID